MKTSTGKPTKAEQARMNAMRELGCICCRLNGRGWTYAEIHHYLSGNKRRGHMFSVPLCPWHHRNDPGFVSSRIEREFNDGPGFHGSTRAFRIRWGRDDDLIQTTNDWLANGYWRE